MHISLWYALEEDLWPMKPNFELGYFSTKTFFHYASKELSIFSNRHFFKIWFFNPLMKRNDEAKHRVDKKMGSLNMSIQDFSQLEEAVIVSLEKLHLPLPISFEVFQRSHIIFLANKKSSINASDCFITLTPTDDPKQSYSVFFHDSFFYVEVNLHFQKIVSSWAAIPQS